MDKEKFMKIVKDNPHINTELRMCWVLIGNYEYRYSPAFGGERLNVLWRKKGNEQKYYCILFSVDFDDIL